MSTTIITVNYHTESWLPGLLASLLEQTSVAEWIIVDNSGELKADLQGPFPIRVIPNVGNPGYAQAVNLAVGQAQSRWVLLLNPDAKLLPNALVNLRLAAQEYQSPVCGPRFFWDDGCNFRMPPAPGDHPWLANALDLAGQHWLEAQMIDHFWQLRHEHFWNQTEPFYEPFLSGACLLCDLEWFIEAQEPLLDSRFFLYYEDTDLCLRLCKQGKQPLCVPSAQVIHYFNQSPEPGTPKEQLMAESRRLYYQKHFGALTPASKLEANEPATDPIWLGEYEESPVFEYDLSTQDQDGPLFLEFALNPFYLPFIQSTAEKGFNALSQEIWRGLAPGRYFTRIRHPRLGIFANWEWTKSGFEPTYQRPFPE